MVSIWPRTTISRAARQVLAVGVDDPFDLVADAAEVAAVHGAEDVDDALDVVVVRPRPFRCRG